MIFEYRVRGRGSEGLHPSAPAGPWLEIEADSFDEARRTLAETSASTGFLYECRERVEEE